MGNIVSGWPAGWEEVVSAAFCGHVRAHRSKELRDAATQCEACEETVVLERRVEALACENDMLSAKLESRSRDVDALEAALGRWRGLPGSASYSQLPPLSGPSSRPSSPVMGLPAMFAKPDVPARVGLSEVNVNRWRR